MLNYETMELNEYKNSIHIKTTFGISNTSYIKIKKEVILNKTQLN
tara:strand:+ start:332 stop:466 length:135 start_codon:yes stop_codon:yes gene_type:complete